jgi:hypothetical protein
VQPTAAPLATPLVTSNGATFAGAPPARLVLATQPLDVDPDGYARWLVRASFVDALGRPTVLLHGGDVDFIPSRGDAQWQTRLRFGGPAAIVSTAVDGPLSVRVVASVGVPIPPAFASTDTRRWNVERVVARALGPHAVYVGWFPAVAAGTPAIVRSHGGVRVALGPDAEPSSGIVDATVLPGNVYRYDVKLPGGFRAILRVAVPAEPPRADRSALQGKKMWLSFSPDPADPDGYEHLDPDVIVARAKTAGLHAILLRTNYGPLNEITPADESTLDALIDRAAARGIATIAWVVPRSTNFEDLAGATGAAQYRTPAGNGFSALAVDLERGGFFLGDGSSGYAAIARYPQALRAALGPSFPIVATVEDPYLEHLSRANYPYDAIATSVDVMQPMAYWRMLSRRMPTPDFVRSAVRGSYAATRREAGRNLPIDMGLQSAGGERGAPSAAEIAAGIDEARKLGALGVTFFDWGGTPRPVWDALASDPW